MKKIITENPQDMIERMHNFVFGKNNEIFVRFVDKDISLVEYIRKMDKELYDIEHDDSYCNALDFGDYMDDDRFTCIMYWALVGFGEVRNYLKYYEEKLGNSNEPRPIEEWGEDYGDCLWWSFPIEEPPYCGTPLDCNFPNHVTHFTRLILPMKSENLK